MSSQANECFALAFGSLLRFCKLRAVGLLFAQVPGKFANSGEFKQVGHGYLDAQSLLQIGVNRDEKQGVASQIEEIVVESDVRDVESPLPELRDGVLDAGVR